MPRSGSGAARIGPVPFSDWKSLKAYQIRVDCCDDDDDDEIAYFTVRWKTRASFVYRTKNMR